MIAMDFFHPLVSGWFNQTFEQLTPPQANGWPPIQAGKNVLVAAPTGSGKTLAAFLCGIDKLVRLAAANQLVDRTYILYVSPLKALANDIRQNLLKPLEEIHLAGSLKIEDFPQIRSQVRTGDTLPAERQKMLRKPPHILVTTPESLFILLTSRRGREMLSEIETFILDEIHAVAPNKRGSHLALTVERLNQLVQDKTGRVPGFQRIGLSATQKPISKIAQFLSPEQPVVTIDSGHRRHLDLGVEVIEAELSAVASREDWEEVYGRLTALIQTHRTTLIFVNTRRLAERVAHDLSQRLEKGSVESHHGSLAREKRLDVENRLRKGELKCVVATASLELGIDIGSVDLVCQISSTRSIALALQRIGRSGHWQGALPKGRFFPLTRDDLIESLALVKAIREGDLDRINIPMAPLDILAQQIIAAAACREWSETELYEVLRRAYPYQALTREEFDEVVTMLSEGFSTRHGRRAAYLHRDRINGLVRGRRMARLAAITSGGAIPENANYLVKADPDETIVGTVDEDFAVESMQGDIFLLGNTSWRIRRVEAGTVRVEDAAGAPPSIPFWRGEAPGRTEELSAWICRIRKEIHARESGDAVTWLQAECRVGRRGAAQAVAYVKGGIAALGELPSQQHVVFERFFDEGGGMQLVIHAPFGSRINKAWGLALRKRFCRSFNFELQAAATENGILLSLSDQHSFPLEAVAGFLSRQTGLDILTQAVLDVPLFPTRWRWTATRALAVLRFAGGKKVPPPIQRIRSDDLLASVFPDSAACLENITGDIEIPDHPLIRETLRDCLEEALDARGLVQVLTRLEEGDLHFSAIDTPEPSPFSQEILNANPYAFLDDAPLEERRARAVLARRSVPQKELEQYGQIAPEIFERVVEEQRPKMRTPDEVHDALIGWIVRPDADLSDERDMLRDLMRQGRVAKLSTPHIHREREDECVFWAPVERLPLARSIFPGATVESKISRSPQFLKKIWRREGDLSTREARQEVVRGWLESSGPETTSSLARRLNQTVSDIREALHALEAEGRVLRGNYSQSVQEREWCDRKVLARAQRLTIRTLRAEIEPVTPSQYMQFLFRWQHVAPGSRLHGKEGLAAILEQLQAFEVATAGWEQAILPRRLSDYQPEDLDQLCLQGNFVWGCFRRALDEVGREADYKLPPRPTRLAPVAFLRRNHLHLFLRPYDAKEQANESSGLSHTASRILEYLNQWGASFVDDLVGSAAHLKVEIESALWELVAAGLVTADSFDGLRALAEPARRLRTSRRGVRQPRTRGRWTLLRPVRPVVPEEKSLKRVFAEQLLARWGVVFRNLVRRESLAPPWGDLLLQFRQMEARGEVRGGRFVSGVAGEQFALPEAVETMRALRRATASTVGPVEISAADPLNLVGIVTPGERIRPHPETILRFLNGVQIEAA